MTSIICGCHVYIVGATDGGMTDINRNTMNFTTVFPSVAASDKIQGYFFAEMDAGLTTLENRAFFQGPVVATPLRAGCSGGSVEIGVENGTVTTTECNLPSNDVSHMAGWFNSPCMDINAARPFWGWHALCWKQHHFGDVLTP